MAIYLSGNSMDDPRQVMVLHLPMLHPRRKIPHLPVIPIVRQPHLRANVQDLVPVDDDSTVVDDVLVDNGPA